MAKKVVVVRVGASTIHIVNMENSASNPTIYGCVRVPTPSGAVDDGMIVDVTEVSRRIHKTCTEKGIRTKDVIFVVNSSKIASRETSIPAVNKAKVSQLVMAKVPDMFPVDAEKYIFAHVLQGGEYEDGENGRLQDVRVFAAPADLIESYYTLASACGMNIVSVEADGNSVFQLMKRQVKGGVSMAVQINQNSTLINVISDNKLLMQRVVSYGINVFTEVMMQEEVFQVKDVDRAYQVLTTQRVLVPNLNTPNPENDFSLSKRIEVTDNGSFLIENIARVIEYYDSKYKNQPINEIICIGQGCSIAGIHQLLSNELGITVTTPKMISGVSFNRKIEIGAAILQYINCFGAVFDPVNFISKEVSDKESKKGGLTGAVLVFCGCLLVSAVLAGFSIFQIITTGDERDFWKSRNDALAPVQSEYNDLKKIESNHDLSQLLKKAVNTNNNSFHKLINEISAVVPKSFRIQSIQSEEDKVTVSAVSKERLLSLSALQMQLNKMDVIKDVVLDSISDSSKGRKRVYTYTLSFYYTKDNTVQNSENSESGENTEGGQTE